MILIYSPSSNPRLQYICRFIFAEQFGVTYNLTTHAESFSTHDGAKINYSDETLAGTIFQLRPHGLLSEADVRTQPIDCFEINGQKAFFATAGDYPFDIFSAAFYLISRYEEYLPHDLDMYGRYAHENSLAFREGFLKLPLVNIWLQQFAKSLTEKFGSLKFRWPEYKFQPTYDIDMAWSFKNKGIFRNLGGFFKKPSLNRLTVLTGMQKDPYDCYDELDRLHAAYKLDPVYFFLVATTNSAYDKNISPYAHPMWQLIKRHAKKYSIGLHPSWKSDSKLPAIEKEKKILETAAKTAVVFSRQHYIKFAAPTTFANLWDAGIREEFSMGYGSINGFRASTASSYFWYDLQTEKITQLRIHPFCFMDANSHFEQKFSLAETTAELQYYAGICKQVNGTFISIFHNNILGSDPAFTGWWEMYEAFIAQAQR
ncbi:MAG: hypothetical protein JWQ27_1404 [Ferruginibacter sp.]|nr:hypothetical protein [Ferruginibacter sp.]